MNKKLFLGMFAAAGILLATSCSNDELDAVQSGNEAQVTFNLGTEGAIATRAISDGLSAKKLVCAIYDANETLLDKVVINGKQVDANGQYVNEEAFQGGLTDQVKVTLAKGQEYTMVFWAQNEACKAYTTTDLTAVKVSYKAENGTDNASNNDDTRDAFYAAETFKVEGNKEINVTLKRPFAQVNVGVYKSDWEAAEASGITIKESSVVIKNVADEINLLTGAVKASEAMANGITYALNAIPNDPAILKADANKDGEDEEYQWLSMSYILVNDIDASVDENGLLGTDKALLEGLQFTFKPESGQSITFEEGLAGAPVRRNWRTNILGKILTGDIQFNITIDNEFEDDYIYPDGTAEQELKFAAAFGGSVTLSDDVTLTEPLKVNADMTLNLNGHSITAGLKEEGRHHYAIDNYATLTLKGNGAISGRGVENFGTMTIDGDITIINLDVNGGSAIWNEGTLTINGGTFKTNNEAGVGSYGSALNTQANGTAVINGGTFEAYSQLTYAIINAGETIINNATVKGKHGAVAGDGSKGTVINGGSFSLMENPDVTDHCVYSVSEIKGGTFTLGNNTDNGAQVFCKSTIADGYSTVEDNGTYIVGKTVSASSSDFTNALNNSNAVNLTENIDNGTAAFEISNNDVVINMENKEVKAGGNGSGNYGFKLYDSDVEVNNADITGGGFNISNSTLTFNSGELNETFNTSSRYLFWVANNSTVIINDGEFHINRTKVRCFYVTEGSSVIINGGTFTSKAKSQTKDWFVTAASEGTITIKGGTFELDPSDWVADGYEAVKNGNTWTVKAK